jgi:hypothetical protein
MLAYRGYPREPGMKAMQIERRAPRLHTLRRKARAPFSVPLPDNAIPQQSHAVIRLSRSWPSGRYERTES